MEKMKLVPALRFPEFEGEWTAQKIKDSFLLISGQHLNPDEYSILKTSTPPYFTGPSDFTNDISKVTKWVLKDGKEANSGDILFTVKGSGVGTLLYLILEKIVMGRQLMAIRSKSASTLLLFHFLSTKIHYFQGLAYGNMIPGLSRDNILNTKVTLPPLPEQQKIATFLSSIDDKIQQLQRKKRLLDLYKKGAMQQIFNQEVRFKDYDGKDYPDWESRKLGDLVLSITNGLSLDQNDSKEGIKVTRIETISNKQIDLKRVGYVIPVHDVSRFKLNVGDILFSNINSVAHIGKTVLIDTDYDLYHGMNLLRMQFDQKTTNPAFIAHLISTEKYKTYFKTICNQAVNQASINQSDLKKTPFKVPSLSEQKRIANFLIAIDDKLNSVNQQLAKTKQFKKGLLQQMFV